MNWLWNDLEVNLFLLSQLKKKKKLNNNQANQLSKTYEEQESWEDRQMDGWMDGWING